MNKKYEDKTNNEILLRIKQLEFEHEALKQKLINGYDQLIAMEEEANSAILEINDRLKKG